MEVVESASANPRESTGTRGPGYSATPGMVYQSNANASEDNGYKCIGNERGCDEHVPWAFMRTSKHETLKHDHSYANKLICTPDGIKREYVRLYSCVRRGKGQRARPT